MQSLFPLTCTYCSYSTYSTLGLIGHHRTRLTPAASGRNRCGSRSVVRLRRSHSKRLLECAEAAPKVCLVLNAAFPHRFSQLDVRFTFFFYCDRLGDRFSLLLDDLPKSSSADPVVALLCVGILTTSAAASAPA